MPAPTGDDRFVQSLSSASDGGGMPQTLPADNEFSALGAELGLGTPLEEEAADTSTEESAEEDNSDAEEPPGSPLRQVVAEWAMVLVGAVLVALVLRALLFQAFWIPSESMEMTLQVDDRVLVNKVSYRLHDVNRGDVVVFERPDYEQGQIRDLIKRVIGLGGDVVEGEDNAIYINGERLIEPYLLPETFTGDFGPVEVPEGHVFMMGDNRTQSFDSRFFGTVDTDKIVGRAFVLFWPLDRVGAL